MSIFNGGVTDLSSIDSGGGIYKIGIYPFSGSVKGTASSISGTLSASYSIAISGFTDTNKMLFFIEDLNDTKINYHTTSSHTDMSNTAKISEYTSSYVTVSAGTITNYKSSSWSVSGLLYVVQFL